VEHPRLLLAEAARVAEHLIVEVPLEDTLRASKDFKASVSGHINFYSHRTIRKLLQSSGFEVKEQIFTPVSYRVYEYQYGWRALYKALPKALYLKLAPTWALNRFTYHSALLCKPMA
jgi:hypothetical protein